MKRFPQDFTEIDELSGGSVMGVDAAGDLIAVPIDLLASGGPPSIMKAPDSELLLFRNSAGDDIGFLDLNEEFDGYAGPATSGAGRFILGTGTPSGDDAALLICRVVTGDHRHGARDESLITGVTNGTAYAAFDAVAEILGTRNHDHVRGHQARMRWSATGTLSEYNSFGSNPIINAGSGAIANLYDFHTSQGLILGTVANRIGHFMDHLTGATTNLGHFNSNPNYLLSSLQIAGPLTGITDLTASGQAVVGSMHATGSGISQYIAGGGVVIAAEFTASGYAAIKAYGDGGAEAGLAILSNNLLIGMGSPVTGARLELNGNLSASGNAAFGGSGSFGGAGSFTGNLATAADFSAAGMAQVGGRFLAQSATGTGPLAQYSAVGGVSIYFEGAGINKYGNVIAHLNTSGDPRPLRLNMNKTPAEGATVQMSMPIYADEAAALAASLEQHTIYVTSTGEVRAKL